MTDQEPDFEDPVVMYRRQQEETWNRLLGDWISPLRILVYGGTVFWLLAFVRFSFFVINLNYSIISGIAAVLCAQFIAPLMILKKDLKERGYL